MNFGGNQPMAEGGGHAIHEGDEDDEVWFGVPHLSWSHQILEDCEVIFLNS